jgi:hypothetical protein
MEPIGFHTNLHSNNTRSIQGKQHQLQIQTNHHATVHMAQYYNPSTHLHGIKNFQTLGTQDV